MTKMPGLRKRASSLREGRRHLGVGLATEWWLSILSAENDAWLGKKGAFLM